MSSNKETEDNLVDWDKYHEEFAQIYNTYLKVVQPFIVQLEIMDTNFPIEILNEIRSIFQHFSKCYAYPDPKNINKNISKANSHLKRAILDCYKYACLSFDDEYKAFLHKYRGVDLSGVNNGDFLKDLTSKRAKAVKLLNDAKYTESLSDDVVVSFNTYCEAYNAYCSVHKLINDNKQYASAARKKQYFWKFVGFMGWAIGIALSIYLAY